MNKISILLFISIAFLRAQSFAENKQKMDSLKIELQNAKHDTTRLKIYKALGDECVIEDNLLYAEPAIKICDKLLSQTKDTLQQKKILKQKAEFYNFFCVYYESIEGAGSKAQLEYLQKRLAIYLDIKDNDGIRSLYGDIANYFEFQGNNMKRLEYIKEGLAVSNKMNNERGMIQFNTDMAFLYAELGDTVLALNYVEKRIGLLKRYTDTLRTGAELRVSGHVYEQLHNYSKAIEYYNKALDWYEARNHIGAMANLYNMLGEIYQKREDLPNALNSFEQALKLANKCNDLGLIVTSLVKIGEIYKVQNQIERAIKFHLEALQISERANQKSLVAFSCVSLSKDYLQAMDFKNAKLYSDRSLDWVKQARNIEDNIQSEQLAAQIDSSLGNYKSALEHRWQYILLRNKLNNDEVKKLAASERFKTEYDKQKAIDKAVSDKEIEQQKIVRNSFVGGFALMFMLAGVSYRNFRRKKKDNKIITQQKTEVENQKHLVEEKNREITDSIEYALRIQTAILPPQKIVKQYLENSFILYKPKDIVAGDFYWMETAPSNSPEGGEIVLFAACDCTGHGVPGAMVSVVCHNALNRAVREFGLTQPAAILDKTTEIVLENFSKSEEEIQDGMDISLCSLTPNLSKGEGDGTYTLQWAGANNPLWIVPREASPSRRLEGLLETKADKQCIGYNHDVKPFTNHTFNLNKGDTIYIFSDGFADQFGGQPERKLTKNRFKESLLSIQQLPIHEQAAALDNFITSYKKEIEQTDDILVIGVRV